MNHGNKTDRHHIIIIKYYIWYIIDYNTLGIQQTMVSYNHPQKKRDSVIIYRKYITVDWFLWNKTRAPPPLSIKGTFPSAKTSQPAETPSCRLGSKYGYTLKVKAYRSPGWKKRNHRADVPNSYGNRKIGARWRYPEIQGDKWNQVRIDDVWFN